MTQYNILNVKLPNSPFNKLKSGIKNGTQVTSNLSSNVGDSNDETDFAHKLFLTDAQILRLCEAFANGISANINFSKTPLSKTVKLGGFCLDFLGLVGHALDASFNAIGETFLGSGIAPTNN